MSKVYQPIKKADGSGFFTEEEYEVYSCSDIVLGEMQAAEVLNLETDMVTPLDPDAICPAMQWPILEYASNPPQSPDGYNDWLLVSGSRQTVKSYTSGMAGLNRVAFTRAGMGATIADNSDRAKDLFEKTLYSMKSIPKHMRPAIINEDNSFTRMRFDQGDKAIATYKILTAGSANVGIGKGLVHCHACLSPDTPVETAEGWRALETIQPGDVLRTHTGEEAVVRAVWGTSRPTLEVYVYGHNEPVIASPEHKWPLSDGRRVTTAELRPLDELVFPVRAIQGARATLRVPQPRNCKRPLPEEVPASYEWGRVLGLYLAEGHIARQHKAPHNVSRVSFSVHTDEVARTHAWLEAVGVHGKTRIPKKGQGGPQVRVGSRQLGEFLLTYCGRTTTKHFPERWWEYPEGFVRGLLHGYFAGDGSAKQESNRSVAGSITTTIRDLAYGARDIVASVYGTWSSIRHRPAGRYYGRNCKASWVVGLRSPTARDLAHLKSVEMLPPSKAYGPRKTTPRIENGVAHIPIREIRPTGEDRPLIDIEVAHPDHSFLLPIGGTGNSEIPFWDDFDGVWDGLYPALNNRKNATVILESTPAPLSEPSAATFKEMLLDARAEYNEDGSRNRFNVLFVPYFMSKANERDWVDDRMKITRDEANLIDLHGPYAEKNRALLQEWLMATTGRYDPLKSPGAPWLTYRNLAFRRDVFANNKKVKRNPDLFDVWFPSDPLTCWAVAGGSTFPKHIVDRHRRGKLVVPWFPDDLGVQVYEDPEPGAVYVIGVDPSGYNLGDPAAFSIWKVWANGDEGFEQVVEFASQAATPMDVAYLLAHYAREYNDAYIVAEKTGVGLATVTQLVQAFERREGGMFIEPISKMEVRLPVRNLHYHKLATGDQTPGMPANKQLNMKVNDAALDMLIKDTTVVRSEALVEQMASYREDRQVRETETHKILNPGQTMKGRKPKHHWDRVSAMMLACYGARFVRCRHKPRTEGDPVKSTEHAHEDVTTFAGIDAWQEREKKRLTAAKRERKLRSRKAGSRRRR